MKTFSRRALALHSALGFASLPLRSLVTGLPIPFLSNFANAQESQFKYLIMSHQQPADPVNSNAPGTYPLNPNDTSDPVAMIQHPTIAELGDIAQGFEKPSTFNLGKTQVRAAAPWATLNPDMRAQMAFWHHGTYTNAHPDFPAVMRFNGAIRGQDGSGTDTLDAVIAQESASGLGVLIKEPLSIGGSRIQFEGRDLPILKPLAIKNLFSGQVAQIDLMVRMRDNFVDRAYRKLKQEGTRAQRAFMDRYTISQQEAAVMGDKLGELITDINGNDQDNQVKMAVALIRLNLAPVISLGLNFGGDNHQDTSLIDEVSQTISAMTTLNLLWQELESAGLTQKTIIASLNTFGRTHFRNKPGGRDHNSLHHAMFVIGNSIKGGVIGGIEPYRKKGKISEFSATAINSASGKSDNNGDIPYAETLVSVGKTLAKSVGISNERINRRFDGGKIISAALF